MRCVVCGGPVRRAGKSGPPPNTCGPGCKKELWRRQARQRYHTKQTGSVPGDEQTLRRLLDDFDYVFPDYTGATPWTVPLIHLPPLKNVGALPT